MLTLTDEEQALAVEVMASPEFYELRDAQAGEGFATAKVLGATDEQAHDIAVRIGLEPELRDSVQMVGFAGLAVHECLLLCAREFGENASGEES